MSIMKTKSVDSLARMRGKKFKVYFQLGILGMVLRVHIIISPAKVIGGLKK